MTETEQKILAALGSISDRLTAVESKPAEAVATAVAPKQVEKVERIEAHDIEATVIELRRNVRFLQKEIEQHLIDYHAEIREIQEKFDGQLSALKEELMTLKQSLGESK